MPTLQELAVEAIDNNQEEGYVLRTALASGRITHHELWSWLRQHADDPKIRAVVITVWHDGEPLYQEILYWAMMDCEETNIPMIELIALHIMKYLSTLEYGRRQLEANLAANIPRTRWILVIGGVRIRLWRRR